MRKKDIENVIVKYGTEAVMRYRKVSGIEQDSQIPEIFLGSFIACGIFDDLKLNAHVERYYTVIASEHEVKMSAALVNAVGYYRADIAVYDQSRPIAIVELKILDDFASINSIVADRDKMAKLSTICHLDCYLGVLITDTEREICAERVQNLSHALKQDFGVIGELQRSQSGLWNWCFAASKVHSQLSSV